MDEDYGAGSRRCSFVERVEVDLPAVIVEERIWDELDVGEIGEEVEERIAWFGNEDFVTGIREEAEDVGIGFAGAGGENDAFGIKFEDTMGFAIVMTDGLAGCEEAARLGIVDESLGIDESLEDGFGVGRNSGFGGIGDGEVEDWLAGLAEVVEGAGQAVWGELPVGASGEHGLENRTREQFTTLFGRCLPVSIERGWWSIFKNQWVAGVFFGDL